MSEKKFDQFDPPLVADLREMQDSINDAVFKMAAMTAVPPIFEVLEADIVARQEGALGPFPVKWILGMNQDLDDWQDVGFSTRVDPADWVTGHWRDSSFVDRYGLATIDWKNPVTRTVEMVNVNLEIMELMFGQGLIPLCDRQIPAQGTE